MKKKLSSEELITKIKLTFPHSLGDGVSWEQTKVIDDRGSEEQEKNARKVDAKIPWPDRVDDPTFLDDVGNGGASFLDPIGFRYHLPIFMVQNILGDATPLGAYDVTPLLSCKPKQPLAQWKELNREMKKVVALFVQFMLSKSVEEANEEDTEKWRSLLESYWQDFL